MKNIARGLRYFRARQITVTLENEVKYDYKVPIFVLIAHLEMDFFEIVSQI